MRSFLQRTGLIEKVTYKFPDSGNKKFENIFKEKVEEGGVNFFSSFFSMALSQYSSKDRKKLRGKLNHGKFKLRRQINNYSFIPSFAIATGTLTRFKNNQELDIEIDGFNFLSIPWYLISISIYVVMFFQLLTNFDGSWIEFLFPLAMIHLVVFILLYVPYKAMRSSIKMLLFEIENDLITSMEKNDR